MSLLNIPISIGELIDKITILRIKQERIADENKVANIRKELQLLEGLCSRHDIDLRLSLVNDLFEINQKLWSVEDDIRDKEFNQQFDDQFIDLARQVYRLNDERFNVKRQLNHHFNSEIVEEKSYRQF